MKNLIPNHSLFIFILCLIFSCNKNNIAFKESSKNEDIRMKYNVYKIDSLNNYYLVYLTKQDSLFKVVSIKNKEYTHCKKIKVNSEIVIKLKPLGIYDEVRRNKENLPLNYMDFADPCVSFDDSTKICVERKMFDLYLSSDLTGLCN